MRNGRYIVVVGCGRLGTHIAEELSRKGDSVVVVDRDDSAFEGLSVDFSGFRLSGDATRISVLREAKLHEADLLIAATNDDDSNLMAAQIAKRIFDVPKAIALTADPVKTELFAKLGVETICPTFAAGGMLMDAAAGAGAAKREKP